MTQAAISVIVPVFNLENHIGRCLQSLVDQDFDQSYEILAINDGSTDNSRQVIEEFCVAHPSLVRSVSKPNGGQGSACNVGLEMAQGDYLVFVDGDDYLDPGYLQEMFDAAIASGADLVMGNLVRHLKSSTEIYRPLPAFLHQKNLERKDRRYLFQSWPTHCGRIHKRNMFQNPALRFIEGTLYADADFAAKTFQAARSILYLNRPWYHYDRRRSGRLMDVSDRRIMDVALMLVDVLEYYDQQQAFEDYHLELLDFTAHHVLSWIPKIIRLQNLQSTQAVEKLFGILDHYFPGWRQSEEVRAFRPMLSRATRILTLPWLLKLDQAIKPNGYALFISQLNRLYQLYNNSRKRLQSTITGAM